MVPHRFPDLGAGPSLVGKRIRRVAELVHVKRARNLRGQTRRHVLVILRMTARDVRARQPHFSPERANVRDFFLRHFVGNNQDGPVTFCAADQGQAQTGVASSRFDDRSAGLQFPIALGGFDHRERDAILDRSARVVVFELEKELAETGVEPRDFDQRRVANQRKDRRRFLMRRGRVRELHHVATTPNYCPRRTAGEHRTAFRRSSARSGGRRLYKSRWSESSSTADRGNV